MRKTITVLLLSLMATGAIAKDEPTKLVTVASKTSTLAKDEPTKWVPLSRDSASAWQIDPSSFQVKVEKAQTYGIVTSRIFDREAKRRFLILAVVSKSECERGQGYVNLMTLDYQPIRREGYSFEGGTDLDGFAQGLCTVLKSRS